MLRSSPAENALETALAKTTARMLSSLPAASNAAITPFIISRLSAFTLGLFRTMHAKPFETSYRTVPSVMRWFSYCAVAVARLVVCRSQHTDFFQHRQQIGDEFFRVLAHRKVPETPHDGGRRTCPPRDVEGPLAGAGIVVFDG